MLCESALLIKFNVACETKSKSINMTNQFVLTMQASGLTVLEEGIFCFFDNEGKVWFTRIVEAKESDSIDESISETT